MKTLRIAALTVAALAASSAFAADQVVVTDQGVGTFSFFKPASVNLEVGTLGYGGSVGWAVNPKTELLLGYTGGSLDKLFEGNLKVDRIEYDSKSDLSNAQILLRMRPTGNWFNVTTGLIVQDNKLDLTGKAIGNNQVTINGNDYKLPQGATITGKAAWRNELAPYLGIGFAPAITNRIGIFGEIGAAYMGEPRVSELRYNGGAAQQVDTQGNVVNPVVTPGQLQNELNIKRNEIEDSTTYSFYPVAKLGVSFRF